MDRTQPTQGGTLKHSQKNPQAELKSTRLRHCKAGYSIAWRGATARQPGDPEGAARLYYGLKLNIKKEQVGSGDFLIKMILPAIYPALSSGRTPKCFPSSTRHH